MSHGLRVWDASGVLSLEITDRLGRYVSTITVGSIGPRSSANYGVPGYSTDGTWFFCLRGAGSEYIQITEGASNFNIFNSDWYYARGSGIIIDVFRS